MANYNNQYSTPITELKDPQNTVRGEGQPYPNNYYQGNYSSQQDYNQYPEQYWTNPSDGYNYGNNEFHYQNNPYAQRTDDNRYTTPHHTNPGQGRGGGCGGRGE